MLRARRANCAGSTGGFRRSVDAESCAPRPRIGASGGQMGERPGAHSPSHGVGIGIVAALPCSPRWCYTEREHFDAVFGAQRSLGVVCGAWDCPRGWWASLTRPCALVSHARAVRPGAAVRAGGGRCCCVRTCARRLGGVSAVGGRVGSLALQRGLAPVLRGARGSRRAALAARSAGALVRA